MKSSPGLIGFFTLARREIRRVLRIWLDTLLPPVITTSLYYVIFGSIIGERIGHMQGVTYIQYIVPGLVMMAVINSCYMNVAFSFFSGKFQHNIEELLVSPMPNSSIIAGYMAGGIFRGLTVGVLVLLVSVFFTKMQISHAFITLAMAILTSLLFAITGLINGMFAKSFDSVSLVPMFVLTPLTYLGGVFYSIDLIPEIWQKATHFNPIFYIVNGFRYGILGISDVGVYLPLAVISAVVIVLYITVWWLIEKGVGIKS